MDYETQLGLITSLLIAYYIGDLDKAVVNLSKQAKVPETVDLFAALKRLNPKALRTAVTLAKDDLQQQLSFN